jgi:branched-chain amino acid transport system ATP-binding protein
VPEGGGIFRPLTVRENISIFAGDKATPEVVDTIVQTFPILGQFLEREAGRLSGGQQQMLAFSRALVTRATTVLVDELSMGLAPIVIDELFEVIRRLRTEGRSLLLVEQYVDRVLDIADYVYLLHKGSVALVGEPDQCRHSAVFDHYLGGQHAAAAAGGRTTS